MHRPISAFARLASAVAGIALLSHCAGDTADSGGQNIAASRRVARTGDITWGYTFKDLPSMFATADAVVRARVLGETELDPEQEMRRRGLTLSITDLIYGSAPDQLTLFDGSMVSRDRRTLYLPNGVPELVPGDELVAILKRGSGSQEWSPIGSSGAFELAGERLERPSSEALTTELKGMSIDDVRRASADASRRVQAGELHRVPDPRDAVQSLRSTLGPTQLVKHLATSRGNVALRVARGASGFCFNVEFEKSATAAVPFCVLNEEYSARVSSGEPFGGSFPVLMGDGSEAVVALGFGDVSMPRVAIVHNGKRRDIATEDLPSSLTAKPLRYFLTEVDSQAARVEKIR